MAAAPVPAPAGSSPLDLALDIHRVRQYFAAALEGAELVRDVRFLRTARRAVLPLPFDRPVRVVNPFTDMPPRRPVRPPEGRLAVVASGGSGATACLVGVARALEEAGRRPDVYSLCSGSALFGFPLAAGLPAAEVADLLLGLRPDRYVDVAWRSLAAAPLAAGRGFTGLLRGEQIEAYFRDRLGDLTLGQLPVPAYAPVWSVEHNRLAYLGPRTHPDVPVARAIRMAVSLPLFFEPVELDGELWCDGGIVDILPAGPVLDAERPCPTTLAVNVFCPPGLAGEDATGWDHQAGSILRAASQVRTSQHLELARQNLRRLRDNGRTLLLEPVPYETVRGAGFYRQFLDVADWPGFMLAGYEHTRRALAESPLPARSRTPG